MTQKPPVKQLENILIVDDELSILHAIQRLCRKKTSWNVLTASSPKEALQILSEQNIVVLITDHQMPMMNGADFLAAIKDKRPNTIKIMLTGQANNEAIKKAINEGAIYKYLIKPWDDNELLHLIEEAIVVYHSRLKEKREYQSSIEKNIELLEFNATLEHKVKERTQQLENSLITLKDINSKLLHSLFQSSRVLFNIIELAKPLLGAHARKVAKTALTIAQQIKMSTSTMQSLEVAALLHDIGKIGFPSFMLEKAVKDYSDNELAMYYKHPQLGAEMLSSLSEYTEISEYILKHHERLDGSGFPNKLISSKIPLQSMIIGIADDVEHLKSRQFHLKDYYFQYAVQFFKDKSEKKYPEKLIDAVIHLLKKEEDNQIAENETTISVKNLIPSMKLSRNLYTISGTLLLAVDTILDLHKINRIREISKIDPLVGEIYVWKFQKEANNVI